MPDSDDSDNDRNLNTDTKGYASAGTKIGYDFFKANGPVGCVTPAPDPFPPPSRPEGGGFLRLGPRPLRRPFAPEESQETAPGFRGTRLWNQSLVCDTFVQQTAAAWGSSALVF